MAVILSAADSLTRRLPKVLTPKAHAATDYLTAGLFFAASAIFWRNHKRAALGAAACGGLKLVSSALTDYDRDGSNLINLSLHSKADFGVAALSAAMPQLLGFTELGPRRFFVAQAVAITALANLTDFKRASSPRRASVERRRQRA